MFSSMTPEKKTPRITAADWGGRALLRDRPA